MAVPEKFGIIVLTLNSRYIQIYKQDTTKEVEQSSIPMARAANKQYVVSALGLNFLIVPSRAW